MNQCVHFSQYVVEKINTRLRPMFQLQFYQLSVSDEQRR